MKKIKLYEGFISDLNKNTQKLIDETKSMIDNCLQVLIDEYDLEFYEFLEDDIFLYNRGYGEKEITHEFIEHLILADKKLRLHGSSISIPSYYYSAVTKKNWYDDNSGKVTGQLQNINNYSSIEEFVKEINRYSEVSVTRLRLAILDI